MAELIALGMVKMIDMRDEIITKWIIRSQVLIWKSNFQVDAVQRLNGDGQAKFIT